jgi:PAS domain S-box-containing protein
MQNEELRRAQAGLDVARARYFDLYDMAPVGYCTISEAGLILEANLTASSLMGVLRGALIKQPITRFILKEDQDIYYRYRKHLFAVHSAGPGQVDKPRVCELRMIKNDEAPFWVRLEGTAAQDTDDMPVCHVVLSDITEHKLAEASMREYQEVLRNLLSDKEILLKEVHHRVKNNLQIISSLINLQADKLPDKRFQGVLIDLRERVRTMALVHEMLYQTDNLEQLNFAGYVASLLQYLWRAHGALGEKVRLNLSLTPLMLPIDTAVPCGLILNELISNAFKHAFPNGTGGEVSVTLENDPASGAVCLRIRDNGIGLPTELKWRQSSTFGLHLVQMLTNQICGTVQTGPGPGAEFQVNFKIQGVSS